MNAAPTRRTTQSHNWPQWVISGIGIVVSVIVATGGYLSNILGRIADLEAERARISQHVVEHERSAGEWKSRIVQCEQDMREMERVIRELTQKPMARPDPFTGTMGRALEERIRKLEKHP